MEISEHCPDEIECCPGCGAMNRSCNFRCPAEIAGTPPVVYVRPDHSRGAVSDDSERERRNALALDIESSIRREWPRLRTMHWPDATLMDAIQRALRDQRGAVSDDVLDAAGRAVADAWLDAALHFHGDEQRVARELARVAIDTARGAVSDDALDRLRFAVDDYLCRMHGVTSSHGCSREEAAAMLEAAFSTDRGAG